MRLPGLVTTALIIACLGPTYTYGQNSDQHRPAESTEPYHKHHDIRHGHDHFYPDRGSVVRDLPPGTIGVSYAGASYRYHDGIWLEPRGPAFIVVAPPIGLVVPTLPTFTTILARNGETYLYCNDTYYRPRPDLGGYEVINDPTNTAPQAGPEGFVGGQVPGSATAAAVPIAGAVVPIGTAPSVTTPTSTAIAVPASAVAPLPNTTTAALAQPGATLPGATALGAATSGAAHATNLLGSTSGSAMPLVAASAGATPIATASLGTAPPGGATSGSATSPIAAPTSGSLGATPLAAAPAGATPVATTSPTAAPLGGTTPSSSTSLVAASAGTSAGATPLAPATAGASPGATPIATASLGTAPLGGATSGSSTSLVAASAGTSPGTTPLTAASLGTAPLAASPAVAPVALAAAPAATASTSPPKGPKVFVYPRNGQNADQQARDRYDCYRFAVGQSGFDPMHTAGGATAPNGELQSDYDRAQAACFDARGYTIR